MWIPRYGVSRPRAMPIGVEIGRVSAQVQLALVFLISGLPGSQFNLIVTRWIRFQVQE